MKTRLTLLAIAMCVASAAAGTNTDGLAIWNTNRLAIYRVTESVPGESLLKGAVGPDTLKLLLADADFVAYDRTNHIFEITSATAKRLAQALRGEKSAKRLRRQQAEDYLYTGIQFEQFVVTAFGRPIYGGAIYSRFSLHGTAAMFPVMISVGPGPAEHGSRQSNIGLRVELWHIELGAGVKPIHDPAMDLIHDPKTAETMRRALDDPMILEALRSLGL